MTLIPFGEFRPDVVPFEGTNSERILNVVPRGDGYGPWSDLLVWTTALPAACRGVFFARNTDGSVALFAATATNLYKLNNTDFTWTNVSLGGGPYASVSSNAQWQFAQFGNLVIATQANVVMQVFDLTSSSAFANLAGSPPQSAYITVVGYFLVASGLLSLPYRIQWSALGDPTGWTAGVNQSDFQDFPDGGIVRGVAGGEYGVIFQDESYRSMVYAPGSPLVFQITRLAEDMGLFAPYAIIRAAEQIFFPAPKGFQYIPAGEGNIAQQIGKERVDRFFFGDAKTPGDVDTSSLQLMIGVADPLAPRVFWYYKSLAGQAGLFDSWLCYDYELKRWTEGETTGEYAATFAKPGLTLENLDPIAPGIITISGAANNGSGKVRLTISGLTSGLTNLNNENSVTVYGVTGTTEANGTWPFTIVNSTHIDLTTVNFVNAYVSGGAIGGAMDGMIIPFDSISTVSQRAIGAVSSGHALGFLNGDNLEAQIETADHGTEQNRIFVSGIRVITDAPGHAVSLGVRDTLQQEPTFLTESAVNTIGICPQRRDTRYARARVRIPAGASWTYALGVEPIVRQSGSR